MRSDDYMSIKNREKIGSFKVKLVHSCMMIDLTDLVTHKFKFWPPNKSFPFNYDDLVIMLYNAETSGLL